MFLNNFSAILLLVCISAYVYSQEAKSKIACEFNSMRLECNGNERLNIIGGNYGRRDGSVCKREQKNNNCINTSTVRIVKQMCEGQQTCVVSASNDVFGDPCAYVEKYLEVIYKCIPEVSCKPGELKCVDGKCVSNTRVCDGWKDCPGGDDEINCRYRTAYGCNYGGLNVECNDGELIRVMKGNFGRNSSVVCQQSPHSACHSPSAFNILKRRCDLMRSCSVPVSIDIFGDPCPNVQDKYIEMQYACWTIPLHF